MTLVSSPVVHDVCASALTAGVALGLLRFWEEMAKRGLFDQKLNRKLVHISIGLAFMPFWLHFSSGSQAPFLAALAPGINIIRMLLMGLGIWKNEAMVKSISRHGDYRELVKGPLYYASTITLATLLFWRTSPIAIDAVCNLCAGDGFGSNESDKEQKDDGENLSECQMAGIQETHSRRRSSAYLYRDKRKWHPR